MNLVKKCIYLSVMLLLVAGCSDTEADENGSNVSESNTTVEQAEDSAQSGDVASEEESVEIEEQNEVATESSVEEEKQVLSQYSAQEIEYARVWLQLGPNQDIDGLYVEYIPSGTPLNPKDETSDAYPEDVIQLSGSRLVDGSITYSGNGDGTINVYNVSKRWDGVYPVEDENFYTDIIEGTEAVYVETGDPDEVKALIELLEAQI
ncbi:hypothetical protein JMA_03390 [Jeotgalibacillus malaysiensis]|uniref:Lipoprotein n=1 Tax=Jeotgalibacillus malaysiensis TaxID=1508404 RepID=A0A0B5AHV6_9BACL|nr:hypothetical protein [Jeotgalibacillus malaysiensis]AJD89656.1 hypothetical protein JMA_03390 [Jeotgalibacillus malaysiensis]